MSFLTCFRAHVIFCLTCHLFPGTCALFILTDLLLLGLWSMLWVFRCFWLWSPEWQVSTAEWSCPRPLGQWCQGRWATGLLLGCLGGVFFSLASPCSFSPRGRGNAAHLFSSFLASWGPGRPGPTRQSQFQTPHPSSPDSHTHTGVHRSLLASLFRVSAAFDSCSRALWSCSSSKREKSSH